MIEFIAVFSLYPSFSCLLSACFLFYKSLGFSSFFPFVSLLKHFSCLVTLFSNIPLPPSLELRFANGSGAGVCCVSLCIFPPSLVTPSPSRCPVASALTQGSQFTAESNIGVSGFSLGLTLARCWHCPGPGYPARPASSASLGPQLQGGSTGTVCYFPSASFHRSGGPPWSRTGGLALSLPDAGYFYSPFLKRSGNGLFPPPAPSRRAPCPSSFIPPRRFVSSVFFSY